MPHTGYMGNYWSGYTGVDDNGDGIGDTSYTILDSNGNEIGTDNYPLMAPYEDYFGESQVSAPVAGFSADVTFGPAPLVVEFTDNSTGATTWAWDFNNDGIPDNTSQNATYTYTSPGTYTVNLTVTNSAGSDSMVKADYIVVDNSDWPQWQRDDVHSGVTTSDAPVAGVSAAWAAKVNSNSGNGVDVTPLVVGDKVFVFDSNATMWAFNKADGSVLWETNTTGGTLQTSIPAYGDGKLFAATNDGKMYAFDLDNGSILWSADVTNGVGNFECPITYSDGKLFIGEGLKNGVQTKYYYCISAENGSVLWSYPVTNTAGFIWGGSVVVGDYLVFPSFEGTLYSVYANNGTLVSSVNLTRDGSFNRSDLGMIRSSLTYKDGYIYATSENGQPVGYIFKIGFQDGSFTSQGWSTLTGFSTSTPVVYDGRIYVGSGEHGNPGKLVCLNDSTGSIIWQYNVSGGVKSSPAVYVNGSSRYIYFTGAEQNGSMYCVDQDGSLVWSYNPPDDAYILQGGVISDGVYFGTDAGYVYCLRETPIPDLAVAISPVENAVKDNVSDVSITVTNVGTAESGPTSLVLTDNGALVGSSSIGAISPGDSVTVSIPWTPGDSGMRSLTATVDPDNEVRESNEYNNEATIIVYVSTGSVTPPPPSSNASWPHFHNDNANTGYTDSKATSTNNLLWESPGVSAVDGSSVVIADGMVFVNGDTLLTALNIADGSIVWSTTVKGDNMHYGSWSSPTYADGMVFLPNDPARWAVNGTRVWPSRSLPWACDSSPTVADGKVFLGDWDGHEVTGKPTAPGETVVGHYFAFNESKGNLLWYVSVAGYAQGTAAYADGKVFLTSWDYTNNDGHAYCVDPNNGSVLWDANLPGNVCGSAAVVDGVVYVATYGSFYGEGDMCALNASDGSLIWRQGIMRTDSTPAVAYGNVYVSGGCLGYSPNEETYCFNATTGDLVWKSNASLNAGDWTCSPAVADGKVYVGKSDGMFPAFNGIYCLDAYNGSVIWSADKGGSSPAIANDTVFTIGNGKVYAYKDNVVSPILPVADFSANVTVGAAPLTVQFTDNSANATSWAWDFNNDGTVDSTIQDPVYTYVTSGAYTVNLTVRNDNGSNSLVKIDYIIVTSSSPGTPSGMGDWPAFHMDSLNTGVTNEPGPLSSVNGDATWAYATGTSSIKMAGIDTVPLVGDGKIYTVGYSGYVYALNPDGTLAWENTQIGGQDSFVIGNPVYHDGVLYVALFMGNATADTGIHAINTDDGSLIWSNNDFTLAQPITPITYDDGYLYVGTWQGSKIYYCVNATTGATVWTRPSTTGGGYYWDGAAVIGNYLVYSDELANLVSVDKKTGDKMGELNVNTTFGVNAKSIKASIAYDPGTQCIYFTSEGGYIHSLGFNTSNGNFDPSRKWNTSIGFSSSTPAIYDGRLYVGGGDFTSGGHVYCLNESNGSVIWAYTANGGVQASPSVSVMDGKPYIYFTSNCANSTAYCLDEDGSLVWSYKPPADKLQYSLQGMAISNGMAFYGNDAGYLFALGSPEVPQAPSADFAGSPLTGTVPLTVQFTDLSSGASSWAWDFDDDGLIDSALQNPSYTYNAPGEYTVCLTVSNSEGTDSMVKPRYVTVNVKSSPSSESFTLNLTAGWNLVSIPLVNDSLWASQLEGTGVLAVATYNRSTNGYDPYVVGFSPLGDNKQIVVDNAYYLLCGHDVSLTIMGVKPVGGDRVISLSPGWNMIGWSSLNSSTAIGLVSTIPGNQTVARHNMTTSGYDPFVEGFSPVEDSFELVPGEGYFVLSDSAQEFDFGGV